MKPCGHCHRHLLDHTIECPFCQRRPLTAGPSLLFSVAVGLGFVGCSDDNNTGETGGNVSSSASSSSSPNDDGIDEGGSYYAGPSASETTWADPTTTGPGADTTTGTSTSSSSTDTDTGTGTGTTTDTGSTTVAPDETTTDAGGSYYAGPSASETTWADEPQFPPVADETERPT